MTDDRITARTQLTEDQQVEQTLRPTRWDEYVGQQQVKDNLQIFIQGARTRNESLDHVLISGPPGLGKTTLANIIASELGVNILPTAGPVLERPKDLAAILSNLRERDVLFVDEIHRLNPTVEETLYPAMEDYKLDLILGQGPARRPTSSPWPTSRSSAPPRGQASSPPPCAIGSVSCCGWTSTRRPTWCRSSPARPGS
jgi:Holliday junction DNA helicase RuvB